MSLYCWQKGGCEIAFFLLDDGTICNEGSGGAAYTIFCTYQMEEDGLSLEVIDYYFTYEKDNFTGESSWFHNTTGEWDRDKSEMLSVEEENKPMEMMEEYLARVRTWDVTYFSEF